MKIFFLSSIILLLFGIFSEVSAFQSGELGFPYTHYFTPKEYKSNPQNWSVLQDASGVMVFANGDGIMKYDGANWKHLPLPNKNLVRSIAFDQKGRLYVGGYDEIGFVDKDELGNERYISLLGKLKENQKEFGHVRQILALQGKIYFLTDKSFLIYNGKAFSEVNLNERGGSIYPFIFHDQLLIQNTNLGLGRLENDEYKLLPEGAYFKGKRITKVIPFQNKALICTYEEGLHVFDGRKSVPFLTETDQFLKTNQLYSAVSMANGNCVFGTLLGGAVVVNSKGRIVQMLNKANSLGDNAVYNIFQDRQGGLWFTHSIGITRVEVHYPASVFNEENGLEGAVNDIVRYNGELYVATMLGLYKLSTLREQTVFQKIPEVSSSVWGIAKTEDALMLATDDGTIELKNGKIKYIDKYSGAVILLSKQNPNIIYLGLTDGLVILNKAGKTWKAIGRIQNIEADIAEMREDKEGNLWIGTFSEGVFQLKFDKQKPEDYLTPQIVAFGVKEGLPSGYVKINEVGGKLYFRIDSDDYSLYGFNPQAKKFEKANPFSAGSENDIFPLDDEDNGLTWIKKREKSNEKWLNLLLIRSSEQLHSKRLNFDRVAEDVQSTLLIEKENAIAWLGGLEGLVRFDFSEKKKPKVPFSVVLNQVKLKNDSVLFEGMNRPAHSLEHPFGFNSLNFSFGATSYDLKEENKYQYFLEGFDDDWSSWSKETTKSYTKIPERRYIFKVRARNIYGDISPVTEYSFRIKPPWYRHPLAYIIYGILLAGLIVGIVRIRSYQLIREKMFLEKIIKERTVEISGKNKQLEQQAEELETQAERLKEMDKIKSNFFANISHEFRTPLSLILNPLEKELDEENRPEKRKEFEMMHRNARRLQNLINQLLDLSKLEAGQMKLFRKKGDITHFIKILLASFESLAQSRNISFSYKIPDDSVEMLFDADKVETVLYNLLSNALKFTPEGGKVNFEMEVDNGECKFQISDTGPGIPKSELQKIFDRFYQVDGGSQREFEGSGIGLSLTKELITLMNGTISVQSEEGTGTSFSIILPLGNLDPQLETHLEAIEDNYYQMLPQPEDEVAINSHRFNGNVVDSSDSVILLVEDNADLRAYISSILEKHYKVIEAPDGEAGLLMARENIPDLILSDMMMPKMDGFALCEEIRKEESTSHIPFILLTARASVENRLEGLELGADDYMTKPFNLKELQIRIKNLLDQRKKLRQRFSTELKIKPKDITVTSVDEKLLTRAMAIVESNIANTEFSVEKFSDEMGMSRKNLHRKLVALTEQPPNEFIRTFRLKRAKQLLEQEAGNVGEVAFATGFNNLSYFAKCFKEQFGVSPAEVKARI